MDDRQHDHSWEDLFITLHKALYSYAVRLTGGRTESVDDLVQDTIVRILRSSHGPTELKSPLAYMLHTMRTVLIDQARKVKHIQISLDDPSVELQNQLPSLEPSTQRDLENKELLDVIRLKSAKLSSRERCLLELMLNGLDCKEISNILNEDVRITRADSNALKAKLKYRLKYSKMFKG